MEPFVAIIEAYFSFYISHEKDQRYAFCLNTVDDVQCVRQ